MSDRKDQESRWSSAREREERDRQRKAQREEARRARLAREEEAKSGGSSFSGSGQRRLTDEERRTIREYRFPSASDRKQPASSDSAPGPPAAEPTASSLSPGQPSSSSTSSTKWRDSIAPTAAAGAAGGGLPDLPGDGNGSGGKRPGNGRLLIFGAGLFAVMALVAFLPFGPFGGEDGDRPVPTSSAVLPTLEPIDGGGAPDEGTDADDAVEQPVASAGRPVVCIDPGHGGWDTGWNRTDQGDDPYSSPIVTEAEINLGMAYMLKAELESEGVFVVLTRPSGAGVNPFDQDVNEDGETRRDAENPDQAADRDELQARINVCNEANADVLISLHINGVTDRSARGYEMIYTFEREFGEQNEALGNVVYRRLDTALRDTEMGGWGRGVEPDTEAQGPEYEFGSAEHYIMTGPAVEIGSIDPSEMPGLIVEAAFLSNDQDAAFIVQPDNQRLVVQAYADGIMDYFEQYPPGS